MIVALALCGAACGKSAGIAVIDRIRVRISRHKHRGFEIALHRRVVRGELVDPIRMLGAVAENDLHPVRCRSLQSLEMR